jgi:hypothetical protein
MKFVCDLKQVSGIPVSSTNKYDRYNIIEYFERGIKHPWPQPNDIFYLSQRLMHWVTPVSPGLAFLSLMTGIHNMVDVLLKVSVNTNDHNFNQKWKFSSDQ